MPQVYFKDRTDAGRQLAEAFAKKSIEDAVVLALPRGGVIVAAEVSKHFKWPLDMVIVRKLGAPFNPELAVGALVEGEKHHTHLNSEMISVLKVTPQYLKEETERKEKEIARQQSVFRGGRARQSVKGKTVILVDDGIATGASVHAAIDGLQSEKPKKLILAVPVMPQDSLEEFKKICDEVICLTAPADFQAVGQFFRDFREVQDAEVLAALRSN